MYKVNKIMSGDTELLPDIVDTTIWEDYDAFSNVKCSKTVRIVGALYKAVEQRENYYQLNSPTAFGDPQYRYYCGLVVGILQGAELEEIAEDDKLIFKKGNRNILIVDKIKRTKNYYDAARDINRTLREIGL